MERIRGISTAITLISSGALFLTPLAASPEVVGLVALIQLTVLAAVILIGKDFTDSGDILRRVQGMREIAQKLAK